VRDRASLETLRGLGLQAELGGDPALLLTPGAGVQRSDAVLLAPRGDVTDATAGLQQTVRGLRAAGVRTVALSLHPHIDDDAARSLGADELISTSEPVRALDAIASCRAVVGVRLHAVILAAAAGVPFVGVAYDPKVSGFCTDAGALSLSTDFAPDTLLAALDGGPLTDWDAVAEMKARAGRSFDLALRYSQR
jgi:polysaccharide pyruvyl transferase WcaK-like protein